MREEERGGVSVFMDETRNRNTREASYKFCSPRAWTIGIGAIVLVALAIGLSVGLSGSDNRSKGAPASVTTDVLADANTYDGDECDYDEERVNVNPFLQCACTGLIDPEGTSDEAKAHFDYLLSDEENVLELNHDDPSLGSNDCTHENVALWFMAMDLAAREEDPGIEMNAQLQQRYFLALLYSHWNGNEWDETENWVVEGDPDDDNSVCSWYGIYCNNDELVTLIDLAEIGLQGFIPSQIGSIKSLIGINLKNNDLVGQIPTEMYSLENLDALDLHGNILTGSLPPDIANMKALGDLDLRDNYFDSAIPPEIADLENLSSLRLEINEFTGTLPDLSKLGDTLIRVFLSENPDIEGTIPDSIGSLSLLQELSLHTMSLTGSIPESIGQSNKLEHFRIDNNFMNGTLPVALSLLTDLTYLDVRDNYFTGTLATELGLLSKAELISFSRNGFNGTIPSELGTMTHLQSLHFGRTFLEGEMPREVCHLHDLENLFAECSGIEECECCDDVETECEEEWQFEFEDEEE